MSDQLPYTGLTLDRAGANRADASWLADLLAHPDSTVIPYWRDQVLASGGRPLWTGAEIVHRHPESKINRHPTPIDWPRAVPPGQGGGCAGVFAGLGDGDEVAVDVDGPVVGDVWGRAVFLGIRGEAGVFALDLSEMDEQAALRFAGADSVVDVRRLVSGLDPDEAACLAYARGLLHWNRNQRFCGACGSAAAASQGGHLRTCEGCGKLLFPRIEPAVIVLVEFGDRCLLGRHRGAAPNAFSTLAGFVEIGESLEDAVRREVAEEAGVAVGDVVYRASQAWPFPAGLMLGFRAVATSPDISVDREELTEARWFTRAEVIALQQEHVAAGTHRGDSIERYLVDRWLAGADP
ncbi:NADH pyrophosphatase [Alloactinosynnema sp. L-07]|uniref:NAD(+) diphosphatase n=1 Tax=Alloactinosynnema sp. L-07 TaxID=1653480 RepID=UPI00065EF1EA|nr:NAD(+) diphosphatase [Alloactinosynnema sp. L-07]CRK57337.1 NADH pyrophosphatase [Alloactinosynnema sp. L-07]